MLTIFLCIIYLCISVNAYCICNTTNIYPCSCRDIEGYTICKESYKTGLNYTNTLTKIIKPFLDENNYNVYTNNLKLLLPNIYCYGLPTCQINLPDYSCKNEEYYYDCEIIKEIVTGISYLSSYTIIDNDIKKIIENINSKITVIINCNALNHNKIIVSNINSVNHSNKNKINYMVVYILFIAMIILF